MNENPGETPNPLNPTPVTTPTEAPTDVVKPVAQNSVSQPIQDTTKNMTDLTTIDPTNRPMGQVAPAPEPKKEKTGLIVSIIFILALAIGGTVTAIMLLNKNSDPVTAAMSKIMSGEAPTNVAVDGTINIATDYENSPISSLNIELKSNVETSSAANDSKAILTADIKSIGKLSAEFDEVYAGDGNLYFKIDGIKNSLESSGLLYLLGIVSQMPGEVDCGEDKYCQTTELQSITSTDDINLSIIEDDALMTDGGQDMLYENNLSYLSSIVNIIEVIDGEWVKVSINDLSITPKIEFFDSDISCITNLVSEINKNSSSAAKLYEENPFITSTNKDIDLASKKYPVYKVGINNKNLAGFINSIQNSNISGNVYSCLNLNNVLEVSENDVAKVFGSMPDIYTEIDNENNFARIYMASDLLLNAEDGISINITMDFNFSYPSNIDISKPEKYQDFDLIKNILSGIYNLPVDNYIEL